MRTNALTAAVAVALAAAVTGCTGQAPVAPSTSAGPMYRNGVVPAVCGVGGASTTITSTTGAGVTVAIVDAGFVDGTVAGLAVLGASTSLVSGESLADDSGHGTEMAEIVHRQAPDSVILAVKAVDAQGQSTRADVAAGIRYATAHGANVINLSLEGGEPDDDVKASLAEASAAGIVVVMAAGNQQTDLDRYAGYPASYGVQNALVVAAVDAADRLGAATNWGATTVQLGAPGVAVPVTAPGGRAATLDGTSPAAAAVSGAVADVLSARGGTGAAGATAASAVAAIEGSARPSAALAGRISTGGVLDVQAALACGEATD